MKKKNKSIPQANIGSHEVDIGANAGNEWTEEHVREVLCNPFVTGIGPFPAIISDEEWVKVASKIIQDEGPEQFLVNLLAILREAIQK